MRIGILGGTFDPIHRGHLHLAREAKKKLALDAVYFVPAYRPPRKEGQKITPARFRLAMLRRALVGCPSFLISRFEIKKKRTVYTVETVNAFRKRHPRDEIFLLTGADNLSILHHWRDLDTIFRIAHFVIATRPGFRPHGFAKNKNIRWLPIRPFNASSTVIRERILAGKSVGRLLPPGVAEFIKKHGLYNRKRP